MEFNVESLPAELLLRICTNLDLRDVFALQKSTERLRKVILNGYYANHFLKLQLQIVGKLVYVNGIKITCRCFELLRFVARLWHPALNLQYLEIVRSSDDETEDFGFRQLVKIVDCLQQTLPRELTSIKIDVAGRPGGAAFECVDHYRKTLKHLVLHGLSDDVIWYSQGHLWPTLLACKNVESLELAFAFDDLTIENADVLTSGLATILLEKYLKYLSLKGGPLLSSDLPRLLRAFKKLPNFTLSLDCPFLKINDLLKSLADFPAVCNGINSLNLHIDPLVAERIDPKLFLEIFPNLTLLRNTNQIEDSSHQKELLRFYVALAAQFLCETKGSGLSRNLELLGVYRPNLLRKMTRMKEEEESYFKTKIKLAIVKERESNGEPKIVIQMQKGDNVVRFTPAVSKKTNALYCIPQKYEW